jgi:hypothetical protein
MFASKLSLALCLQSKKISLHSFFHLGKENGTPLKIRRFLWIHMYQDAKIMTSMEQVY